MAAGLRTGLDCKGYYNSANYAVPTWVEINIIVDVTHNLEIEIAEVKARLSTWIKGLPTHKKTPLDFKMVKDTSNAGYGAIRNAATGRTSIDMAFADDAIATSGTEYFRSEWFVSKFSNGQPIDGVNVVDVSVVPAAGTANDPGFTTVGS